VKKLIIINGTTGVGKTSVGRLLFKSLSKSTFLDGDDVWQIHPFVVNEETKEMVHKNIAYILRTYLQSSYENIIFVWVLHQQEIIDLIVNGLSGIKYKLYIFTLIVDEKILLDRIKSDKNNPRDQQIALDRLRSSLKLNTTKIDSSHLSPNEVVDKILLALK